MGDGDDPRNPAPLLRVVDVAVLLTIVSTLLAAPGVYWLLRREPHDDLAQSLLMVLLVPGTLFLAGATSWWALRSPHRRRALRCVAIPILAGAIGIGGVVGAEPLHWSRSESDFAAVANGAPFPCAAKQRCRLGWWTIIDHARDDTVTVVWFPTGNDACYGGRGLARPGDQTIGEQALYASITNLTHRSSMRLTRGRDGWYRICASS